jgi:hypothetical protein
MVFVWQTSTQTTELPGAKRKSDRRKKVTFSTACWGSIVTLPFQKTLECDQRGSVDGQLKSFEKIKVQKEF